MKANVQFISIEELMNMPNSIVVENYNRSGKDVWFKDKDMNVGTRVDDQLLGKYKKVYDITAYSNNRYKIKETPFSPEHFVDVCFIKKIDLLYGEYYRPDYISTTAYTTMTNYGTAYDTTWRAEYI